MNIQQFLDDLLASDVGMQEYVAKFWYVPEGSAPNPECNYVLRLNSTASAERHITIGVVAKQKLIVILEPILALAGTSVS